MIGGGPVDDHLRGQRRPGYRKFQGRASFHFGVAVARVKGMGKSGILSMLNLFLMLSVSDGKAQWMRAYASGKADVSNGCAETFQHALLYYAGDSTGMITSTDEGNTWTSENAGLRLGAGSDGYYSHFCRALTALG